MAAFLTYKRWRLRNGVDAQAVINMVRDRIVPHYKALDRTVRLGLEQIDGSHAVLAPSAGPIANIKTGLLGGVAFQALGRARTGGVAAANVRLADLAHPVVVVYCSGVLHRAQPGLRKGVTGLARRSVVAALRRLASELLPKWARDREHARQSSRLTRS